MRPLVFNFGVADELFSDIAAALNADTGDIERRSFPDGETYLRCRSECAGRHVIMLCSLDRADAKILPLILACETARDLGAAAIGLIAPYLGYMRQDSCFQTGEGVSARYFAKLLSSHFDWLVTVDPHLHRFHDLAEIFTIPTRVARTAQALAEWVTKNVASPFLIGPDAESEQWVAAVAQRARAPYLILRKIRSGDRSVEVSIPALDAQRNRVPVILDDMVSTGETMLATIRHLTTARMRPPFCVVVHAVFADGASAALRAAGAAQLVTCNTIEHASNVINVARSVSDEALHIIEHFAPPVAGMQPR